MSKGAGNRFRLVARIAPHRLAVQVPLLVTILVVATIGFFSWFTADKQAQLVSHGLQLRLNVLARNVATSSADYLLSGDLASLEQLVIQAADFPGVLRIQVSDHEGTVLADVKREPGSSPHPIFGLKKIPLPSGEKPVLINRGDEIQYWYPIVVGNQLGWVVINHSLSEVNQITSLLWQDSIITGIIAILASIVLLSYFLRRPLSAIQRAATFAKNLDELQGKKIKVERHAIEIQELDEALNIASIRLREASKGLSDQKFALDQSSIVSISDTNGQITYVNEKYCVISGYSREELLNFNQYFLSSDFYTEEFFKDLQNTVLDGHVWQGELQNRKKDSGVFWVRATIVPFMDEKGKPYQFVSIMNDITERKQAEAQMKKLSSALEKTADSVFITDTAGVIEYVNPAFEEVTGYSRDEAIGNKAGIVKSGRMDHGFYNRMWLMIKGGEVFSDVFINRKKGGELYYEEKTITPLKDDDGNITHFISTGKDITERMQVQERMQYLAQHDILTDLPNRMLFLDRLNQALARSHWHKRHVALFFLDLDRFKVINDTLGHDAGDRLLQTVAKRLGECVREGDTIARLGGDEFTVILEDVATQSDIPVVARKIIESMSKPFYINNRELFITVSIGISVSPGDANNAADLVRNADTAMYRAKDEGRNNYQFYSVDMDINALERLNLETSLRRALEREEFILYYQPQINIRTGYIFGVEALIRWNHPDLGLVSPAKFIPLLEETGLIIQVGEWVLRTACAQTRVWQVAGLVPLQVSINMSAYQFNDPGLPDIISRTLHKSGLDPALLEIEITESVFMQHTHTIKTTFQKLRDLGVRVAIDDFGTGYSSLSYLRRYPVDCLKVDQSFVHDITTDPDDAEIVKAILAMAQSLKLSIIAEGVETQEQLKFLQEWGCELMQGLLFSPPLPTNEIELLLQQGSQTKTWLA